MGALRRSQEPNNNVEGDGDGGCLSVINAEEKFME
jgi:hypothetical protein